MQLQLTASAFRFTLYVNDACSFDLMTCVTLRCRDQRKVNDEERTAQAASAGKAGCTQINDGDTIIDGASAF